MKTICVENQYRVWFLLHQFLITAYLLNSSGKHFRAMNTPKTPLLYSETGVCSGIPIFLIFAPKQRLWVLVRTASARRF